ncbi:unnamed protein product [Effrenium voratum]|uniref:Uncharacterized protein n=1 Tax=Effrenium voratum TaxID=2562239 RepID=A0AA36HQ42_9DINO|nr:unnamed protein product [Effrenium voratum]
MLACRGFASSHVLFARTLCAWPAQKMPFRLTTRHSSSIQTVGVEALAEYIHAQINGTFSNVEEQLTELAQILGYMTEAQRQEICIADAKLLVEDIGACPLSLESHLRGGAETPSPEEDASSGAAMPALRGEETDAELAVQAFIEAKNGQSHQATPFIKQHGIHVPAGGAKGWQFVLIAYDPLGRKDGRKLVLTQNTKDSQRDAKRLRQFILQNQQPGMVKCDRCHQWWDRHTHIQHHELDLGGCHGFCPTASKRSG